MIGLIQLVEVTIQTRLDLRQTPPHLGTRKVPVAGVRSLELAAVNNHQPLTKQVQTAAQDDKLTTYTTNRLAVVLAEVRNRLVVRQQPLGQPHQFHVALGFSLNTTAGLDPVEVGVNIEAELVSDDSILSLRISITLIP